MKLLTERGLRTSQAFRRDALSILRKARKASPDAAHARELDRSSGRSSKAARSPAFTAQDVRALASAGTIQTFRKQTVIVSEGDENDSFYIVLSGRIKTFVSDEHGRELVLSTQGPSEYFGETMLDGGPRVASVMTVEPSRIAIVSKAQFIEFLLAHPYVAIKVMQKFAGRVRVLTRKVKSFALMDVHARVTRLLMELSVVHNGARVLERISQQEIANRVGASREMISRVLKDLCERGYIAIDKKHITILKRPPGAE